MKSVLLIVATLSTTGMADSVGTATGKVDTAGGAKSGTSAAVEKTATEYGDDYVQSASTDKAQWQLFPASATFRH